MNLITHEAFLNTSTSRGMRHYARCHRAYYAQFVTPELRALLLERIGEQALVRALRLTDFPLCASLVALGQEAATHALLDQAALSAAADPPARMQYAVHMAVHEAAEQLRDEERATPLRNWPPTA